MSATLSAIPALPVLHSEWLKIRSLRGTFGSLLAVLVATAGIQALTAFLIGGSDEGAMGDDPLLAAFYGINFGQIAAIAFGASAFSAEFHNGALRTTLSAVPDRTRFYLSKIAVVGGLALLAGQFTGILAFVGGQAFMGSHALGLGEPGTWGDRRQRPLPDPHGAARGRSDGGPAQRGGRAEHPHTVHPAGLLRRLGGGGRSRSVPPGPRRADGDADRGGGRSRAVDGTGRDGAVGGGRRGGGLGGDMPPGRVR